MTTFDNDASGCCFLLADDVLLGEFVPCRGGQYLGSLESLPEHLCLAVHAYQASLRQSILLDDV